MQEQTQEHDATLNDALAYQALQGAMDTVHLLAEGHAEPHVLSSIANTFLQSVEGKHVVELLNSLDSTARSSVAGHNRSLVTLRLLVNWRSSVQGLQLTR